MRTSEPLSDPRPPISEALHCLANIDGGTESRLGNVAQRPRNHLAEPNESIDGNRSPSERRVHRFESSSATPPRIPADGLRKEKPVDVLYRGLDLQNRALSQILDWLHTSLLNVKAKAHISMFAGVVAP